MSCLNREKLLLENISLQLNHLAEKIQEKRPYTEREHRPAMIQHNNAKPHKSSVVYQTISELR